MGVFSSSRCSRGCSLAELRQLMGNMTKSCCQGREPPPPLTSHDQIFTQYCIRPGCNKEFKEFYPPNHELYDETGRLIPNKCPVECVTKPDKVQLTEISTVETYFEGGKQKTREKMEWLEPSHDAAACYFHIGQIVKTEVWNGRTGVNQARYMWDCCKVSDPAAKGCCRLPFHVAAQPRNCMPSIPILQLQPPIAPVFKHDLQLKKIVIFVDDTNTAASQMCKGWSGLEHFNAEFESAGTDARQGEPIHHLAAGALGQLGCDASKFTAQQLTTHMISKAALVLCMSSRAVEQAKEICKLQQDRDKVKPIMDRDVRFENPSAREEYDKFLREIPIKITFKLREASISQKKS